MQEADLTGKWIEEAVQYREADENVQEIDQLNESDEDTGQTEREGGNRQQETFQQRERELMRRELELLRRENEMLRRSPRESNVSNTPRPTTSVKNISELLGEYNGSSEEFERWKAQIDLLRNTYELDENTSKILVGSKLKGKALRWYHSRANHLALNVEELLQEMRAMFDQPLGRLEARKKFEAREWRKNEAFNNYCHDKLILGNRVPVTKSELVDYLIDGIPSESLQNQAKMHSFSSV